MVKKINVCIVGFGYWGPNLVRNFSRVKDVKVKYICDLDDTRIKAAKEFYPNIEVIKGYEEVLEDTEINAVVIATPVSTHFNLASTALKKGKDVLLEKPMARTVEEAENLVELAKKHDRILMVDHTFEYSTPIAKIKEYVDEEVLGQIYSISFARLNLGLFQKDINVIWDLCPHDISIMLYILNKKPLYVNAVGAAHVQPGIEDDANVFITFEDNITASMHVSWLDPVKIRRMTVVGSKKMVLYDDVEPVDKIKLYDKGLVNKKNGLPIHPYYTTIEEFQLAYKHGDTSIPKLDIKEPLFVMAQHFIDCVKERKTPRSDGLSGLRVIRILDAANKSLKEKGKLIKINERFN